MDRGRAGSTWPALVFTLNSCDGVAALRSGVEEEEAAAAAAAAAAATCCCLV